MFQWLWPRLSRYRTELFLFLVAVLARGSYWAVNGTFPGGDWNAYRAACELWWTDPVAILTARKGVVYSGFTLPFCSVYGLPFTTVDTWVVLQIAISALGVVLIYRAGTILMNRTAGIVAGLALAVLWDTFQWTVVLYSDAMFTFAMAFCLWAFARYHQFGTTRSKVLLIFGFGFLTVSRPFGFPIVVGWILYEMWPSSRFVDVRIFARKWIPIGSAAMAVAAIPWVIDRYHLVNTWSEGAVVINDPTYAYQLPSPNEGSMLGLVIANHIHVLVLAAYKVVMFFAPFLTRHSMIHIVANVVTYIPIVGLGLVGAVLVWRNRPDIFRYAVTPILVTLLITAVTFVSWDFRYRAPLGPAFALLAAYAVVSLWEKWRNDETPGM